jgi:23S rRNA pseudouridine2605 synthase
MEKEHFKGKKQNISRKKPAPYKKRSAKPKTENKENDWDAPSRLNKFLSNSGVCSRRDADELIKSGQITVNGNIVTELGTKVSPKDDVKYKGKRVSKEQKIYILLNKPKDVVTTVSDKHAEKTVLDIVKDACSERIYPVGRLDKNTTGLLLLTNDGELTKQLTHPSFQKKKIYHVHLDKDLTKADLQRIVDGLQLEDDFIIPDAISYVEENDRAQVGIEIHTGQNRIVRRIFESLDYRVKKLDRVYFAGLTKKNLPRGKFRFLTPVEISVLKRKSFK